ncbi:MAG: ABC transporter ATP-binding protein [Alphaproteobacteria bacterium]|nr:ABC transporter ATP-binding protein [Alphaproteobacteria bacterium]
MGQSSIEKGQTGTDGGPLVRISDVHLNLRSGAGEVNILRGVDFTAQKGETVAIVGPSGAGKSTLMMVMAGLETPTGGGVVVDGQDLTKLSEDQLALFRRDRVGIVFQAFRLIPTMTALENVAVPLELAGHDHAFESAEEALNAVGLGHRMTHYPSQLSGGEQQRTALARAVATKPSLILADEPTGNLDGTTGEKIIDLLFGLSRQQGATLVLITHDEGLAARCDRRVHIADGQITEIDTVVKPGTPMAKSA